MKTKKTKIQNSTYSLHQANKAKNLTIQSNTPIEDILKTLDDGIKNLRSTNAYQKYLNFISKIPHYSSNNQMLLYKQNPNITMVGSYTFWKQNHRYIKKGEKSLKIIAPIISKKTLRTPMLDSKNQPLLDIDKQLIYKTSEKLEIKGFRYVSVFDISQTDGEPIPTLFTRLKGNSSEATKLINIISSISETPIIYKTIDNSLHGYFEPEENKIVIQKGLSENQTAKTILHEYAHSILHKDLDAYNKNYAICEIEAESIAYIISNRYGLDSSDYSFGYITTLLSDNPLGSLKPSLDIIRNTASDIVKKIDTKLQIEYEQELEQKIVQIKQEIKKQGFHPTNSLVDNLAKLEQYTNTFLLEDIYKMAKQNTITSNQNAFPILKNIIQELQNQETSLHCLPISITQELS